MANDELSAKQSFRQGESYEELRLYCRAPFEITQTKNQEQISEGRLRSLLETISEIDSKMDSCQSKVSVHMTVSFVLLALQVVLFCTLYVNIVRS